MGSQKTIPNKILFHVQPQNQLRFGTANLLRLIRGQTKEEFFHSLIVKELETPEARLALSKHWVRWNELEAIMRDHGIYINRTAFSNYRQRPDFAALTRGDGIDIVWDVQGILEFFKGNDEKISNTD